MNDSDTITFENKNYVSPTVSRDEQMSFIDTLRQTGAENVDRINRDTQALGSQVDPMYGGLSKGTQFTDRYVTPQTNALVDTLRATAQQTALNQALSNLQEQYTQRYNEAYRNAKVREWDEYQAEKAAAKAAANNNNTTTTTTTGDVDTTTGYNLSATMSVPGVTGGYTVANPASVDENGNMTTDGYTYVPYGSTDNYTYTNKDLSSGTSSSSSGNRKNIQELLTENLIKFNF